MCEERIPAGIDLALLVTSSRTSQTRSRAWKPACQWHGRHRRGHPRGTGRPDVDGPARVAEPAPRRRLPLPDPFTMRPEPISGRSIDVDVQLDPGTVMEQLPKITHVI